MTKWFTLIAMLIPLFFGALDVFYTPLGPNEIRPISLTAVLNMVDDAVYARNGAVALQYVKDGVKTATYMFAQPVENTDIWKFVALDASKTNPIFHLCRECAGMGQAVNQKTFTEFVGALEKAG